MADKGNERKTLRDFPNPLVSESEKEENSYGMATARAIWGEANGKHRTYFNQRKRIVELRNAATDTQSIEKYKSEDVKKSGNTSLNTINYNVSSVVPNIVNISSSKLVDRGYDVSFESIDKDSKDEFDAKMTEKVGKIKARKAALKMLESGEDNETIQRILAETEGVGTSIDDATFDMEMNWKTEAEESYEAAVDFVFMNNPIEEIEKVVARDLHVLQRAGAMAYLDFNGDIRVDWVDQKNIVTGYCTHPDFSDCKYIGVVREMKLSDVKARCGDGYTDEDYFDMASRWTSEFGNDRFTLGSYYTSDFNVTDFGDYKVLVLFFQIKLPNTIINRKKVSNKGSSMSYDMMKDTYTDTYTDDSGEEKKKRGVVSVDTTEVVDIYQGYYACDSAFMWGWEKKPNMTRKAEDGIYSTDTDFDIVMYAPQMQDMTTKSMVERMLPHVEKMIGLDIKIQQLVNNSRPSGVVLDIAALQGITTGVGERFINHKEAQKIFDEVGNLYINSVRADGTPAIAQGTSPVTELSGGLANGLNELIALNNYHISQIYQVTGVNPAVDGTMPSKGTLVGAIEAQEMAYNSATAPLLSAYVNIFERLINRVVLLIQNQMDVGTKVKAYKKAIGGARTMVIEDTKKIKLAGIGIKTRLKPTASEKLEFLKDLNRAVETDQVGAGDAMRAKEMLNVSVKEASEFLTRKIEKYAKNKAEMAQQAAELDTQSKLQVVQAEQQSLAQKIQIENQAAMQLEAQKHQNKMEELNLEYNRKENLARVDGDVKQDLIEKAADVESDSSSEASKVGDAQRKRGDAKPFSGSGVRTGVLPADDVQQGL